MPDDKRLIGIERRRFSDAVSLEEIELHIEERIKKHLEKHSKEEADMFDRKFNEIKDMFKSAFPEGNLFKHLEYHEEQIEYMKSQREFYSDLKKRGSFWLLVLLATAMGKAAWEYMKAKVGG